MLKDTTGHKDLLSLSFLILVKVKKLKQLS